METLTLPTLFLSHGSPMLAVEDDAATAAWDRIGRALPRPRAVLVASAHWLTAAPALGAAARPETIHDFGGFPEALYQVRYPVAGDPGLAREAAELLQAAGLPAALDPGRGLDHGVWVVLRHLFPDADVPVAPLSLQPRLGAAHHYRLGQALAPLRDRGVLILGSGGFVHNLREYFEGQYRAGEPAHVRDFRAWMAARLAAGDVEALTDYRSQAPFAARAHPTDEHLLPLYVALGAAGRPAPAQLLHDQVADGVLGMDAYAFGTPLSLDLPRAKPALTGTHG
ncbi:MAG TPA: class III extradiol ring-cleavage dioxygenase [Solimonas sp.]|nr:class III extradiol ring-cleavage dioxygenase [Solimonas sp.]